MQFAHYLNFFMKSSETTKVKVSVAEERAAKIEKKFYKVEVYAMEAKKVFR